jgi:thiamine-phosphate pyrophosphorylase
MFNKLQYISQGITAREQERNICEALDAGCKWIQLRCKNALYSELMSLALTIKERCDAYAATYIINDNPVLAQQANACGVHLGLQDMSIEQAKKIVGDKIVGGTANTLQQVLQRVEEGCSYVGLGPLRFTTTKEKLSPVLGFEGYANIINALRKSSNIQMPVYAIGGILIDDIETLIRTGVHGVAVSGAITHATDKRLVIQQFNELLIKK